jgi:hypothetical protein
MSSVINGEIVVITQVANVPLGGYVFTAYDGNVTLLRASLNEAGKVQFLYAYNIVIPDARINYVEKLYPHSSSTLMEGSDVDVVADENDSDRIKEWLESRGVKLS